MPSRGQTLPLALKAVRTSELRFKKKEGIKYHIDPYSFILEDRYETSAWLTNAKMPKQHLIISRSVQARCNYLFWSTLIAAHLSAAGGAPLRLLPPRERLWLA